MTSAKSSGLLNAVLDGHGQGMTYIHASDAYMRHK